MESLVAIFSVLLGQSPQIIIWIVGMVLALSRRQQSPRKSRLAFIAFAGFLILAALNAILNIYLPFLLNDTTITVFSNIFGAVNIVLSLLSAGLWVLLLVALFGEEADANVKFDGLG